jgi:hypothetical protein
VEINNNSSSLSTEVTTEEAETKEATGADIEAVAEAEETTTTTGAAEVEGIREIITRETIKGEGTKARNRTTSSLSSSRQGHRIRDLETTRSLEGEAGEEIEAEEEDIEEAILHLDKEEAEEAQAEELATISQAMASACELTADLSTHLTKSSTSSTRPRLK